MPLLRRPAVVHGIAVSVTPASTPLHYFANNAGAYCDDTKATRYDRLWCVLWGQVVCRVLSQSDASEPIVGEKGIGESVRPITPTQRKIRAQAARLAAELHQGRS